MVLAELGSKLQQALAKMGQATVIDDKVIDNLINTIGSALVQSDVEVRLVKALQTTIRQSVAQQAEQAAGANKRRLIQSAVIRELVALLDSGGVPFTPKKGRANVVMFVGLQGSGKTTSCSKYAYYYHRKGWKAALVCADTFRAGAFDQLKQNAVKAKIPFYGSYTERDPVLVAEEGVRQFKADKFELIVVDTSGRHKQEAALFEEMQEVARAIKPDDIVFVMDSSIGQAAKDQARAFKEAVSVGSVIITKLDGHAKGGGALSAVAATKSPIVFVGTGEHIDEFELFNSRSFVSRLLGLGDISGLLSRLEEEKMFDQPELLKKLTEGGGDFTFRDVYEQFTNILKLGPLSQVMSMIPGLSGLIGPGKEKESVQRIRRFMSIMDSMTQEELDSTDRIFNLQPHRCVRIARGAGVSVRAVHELVLTYKQFKGVAGKMKGLSGLMDPKKMSNPRAMQGMMQQMQQMMSPQMLQQMGGAAGMQRMMQQMAAGGGPPGMPGMPGAGAGGLQQLMGAMGGGASGDMADMMAAMGGGAGMGGMGGPARGKPARATAAGAKKARKSALDDAD